MALRGSQAGVVIAAEETLLRRPSTVQTWDRRLGHVPVLPGSEGALLFHHPPQQVSELGRFVQGPPHQVKFVGRHQ